MHESPEPGVGWLRAVSARSWILSAAVLIFLVVLARTAWICDDAYITFRAVDNFINGYGPVWNVGERVQAFTHPLWFAVLSVACVFTREPYFTAIGLSLVSSVAAVSVLAWRVAESRTTAVLGLLSLTLSKAFVDYSSSGLENPLSHLLLAVFLAILWTTPAEPRRLSRLFFVGSLVVVNRPDLGLLVGPALVSESLRQRDWRVVARAALAVWPFVAWEVFSLVYYGFPFPNTAYAKLATGIPGNELREQGLTYLVDLAHSDRVAVLLLAWGFIASLIIRPRRNWPLAAGLAAYTLYVVWIGGDFMSGRFFTAPILWATFALCRFGVPRAVLLRVVAYAAVIGLGLTAQSPTLTSGSGYGQAGSPIGPNGISDERRFYFQATGLLRHDGWFRLPDPDPRPARALSEGRRIVLRDDIGHFGYTAGRQLHVVDIIGLADPLLARLPSDKRPWRIGHFYRTVPEGYVETIATGRNVIRDPGVGHFYNQLAIVTKGPIWRWKRVSVIFGLLRGKFDSDLADFKRGLR